MPNTSENRLELRVSKEDRKLFEIACALKGFKSLSEFARQAIQKEAKAIIEEEQRILHSKRDKEIFFTALMNEEEKPKEALLEAIKFHKKLLTP